MNSSSSESRSMGVDCVATTKSGPRRVNDRAHGIGTEVQMHDDPTEHALAYVNVTDPQGVLIGRFPVTADDLLHPQGIGDQVLEQFPDWTVPAQPAESDDWGEVQDGE